VGEIVTYPRRDRRRCSSEHRLLLTKEIFEAPIKHGTTNLKEKMRPLATSA